MKPAFKAQDHNDGKLITLSAAMKGRKKILDLCYAIFNGIAALFFLYLGFSEDSYIGLSIIAWAAFIVFAIVFIRFINKACESEKLFVNRERMDIIRDTLFHHRKRSFQISGISNFRFNEKVKYEPHPLKGETFDYLGFQTEQEVIQDLHAEGRISFDYKGKSQKFGKDIYQWEFDELGIILYEITGNDFRSSDKYEQDNAPET